MAKSLVIMATIIFYLALIVTDIKPDEEVSDNVYLKWKTFHESTREHGDRLAWKKSLNEINNNVKNTYCSDVNRKEFKKITAVKIIEDSEESPIINANYTIGPLNACFYVMTRNSGKFDLKVFGLRF